MRVFFAEYLSGLTDEPLDAALLAQGLAMRDAVLADLRDCAARDPALRIACAVAARAPLPPGFEAVRQHALQPGESAVDFVRRQASGHEVVWLIAPETDGLLASLCNAVPPAKWLGCDAASTLLAASKARTTALLHARGVLTPHAFASEAGSWVVKPDDGVGGTDARRHARREDAEGDLARRHGPAVLEPWVEGAAMSLTLLCDGRGHAELWSVNQQTIEVGVDGALMERGVEPVAASAGPALWQLAQQVARALPGLFGPVGIDYIAHPARGPVLIEVNPRVTSVYGGLLKQQPARSLARATLDLWATRAGSPPAR